MPAVKNLVALSRTFIQDVVIALDTILISQSYLMQDFMFLVLCKVFPRTF